MTIAADATFTAAELANVETATATANGADLTVASADVKGANNISTFNGHNGGLDVEKLIVKGTAAADTLDYSTGLTINADGQLQVDAGAGDDVVTGTGGNDILNGEDGADTLMGGAGADTLTGGAGADTFKGFDVEDQSIVASAHTFNATDDNIAATETITFATTAAGNVDVIADFVSGTDKLDVTNANTAPTSLIGVDSTAALTDGTAYVLYGTYVAGTGVFTAAAAFDATTAKDALFVEGDGTETAINETDYVVLTGLNQALVAADFV